MRLQFLIFFFNFIVINNFYNTKIIFQEYHIFYYIWWTIK